ncbi:unnamed protein product [Triticum turgidum subsp. durum]|uniref:Cytochrome P450 n=1 Tax=Triticum turgidum subsp. durum TaxID=4567 RepID=A0A9R1NG31_TRITD|nr:unnamed protein product [Triticum turgidum subsp. durum]
MADLLLLMLPLALLFFLLHHASPIKALLTRAKSVLAPELSTVWKPQPASIFVTNHETAHSLLIQNTLPMVSTGAPFVTTSHRRSFTRRGSTALQWIMANLVKRPDIQEAVRREIDAVVNADADEVSENVLGELEYLHTVVMKTLRLHPPTSFAFRQVMEEDHVVHNGQRIPVGTKVYFPLAAIARDSTAWDNPDEFKPQRFLASKGASEGTDNTIKMMPFGGGRRICPGRGVAMLHLSYFTANLVREFRWREGEGELAVDLQLHVEFFTVMKRPLCAHLELRGTEIKTRVN